MRVHGNDVPASVTVESFMTMKGYVEVRLRENVQPVIVHDETTDTDINLYEYDEYIIYAKAKDGLIDEIRNNLGEWIATGRLLEVNQSASLVRDMQQALEVMGVIVNE